MVNSSWVLTFVILEHCVGQGQVHEIHVARVLDSDVKIDHFPHALVALEAEPLLYQKGRDLAPRQNGLDCRRARVHSVSG